MSSPRALPTKLIDACRNIFPKSLSSRLRSARRCAPPVSPRVVVPGRYIYSTLVSQTRMVTVHQVSAPFSNPASRCNLKRTKGPSRPRPRAFLGVSPASSLRPENSRGAGAAAAPGDLRGDSREKLKRAREKGEDEERAREMNRFYRAWKYSNKQRRKSEFVHLTNKGMMRK